ncbi:MAG: uroporphyrinogen-III synthase, partial [Methylococcaceae bacterium]|nr:uroporphyrinogen-III synthase [Methylococcaceae bacterium]
IDRQGLLDRWRKGEIEVVSITSGEALDYLVRLMEESGMELLHQTPMVFIGERLEKRARELGCTHVAAAEASDLGIFDALVRIAREVIKTYQPRG